MTRSITFPTEQRNPFSLPERMQEVPVAVTEKATTSAIPAPAVPLTASELGIVVESIAYGRTKRMAMVNGKPVREDDLITIKTAAVATTAQRARVISILPAEVLLELEGRTIPAQLRRKGLASEDSIGLITPTFGTN